MVYDGIRIYWIVELGQRGTAQLVWPWPDGQFRIYVLRHGVFEGKGPPVIEPFCCRDAKVC